MNRSRYNTIRASIRSNGFAYTLRSLCVLTTERAEACALNYAMTDRDELAARQNARMHGESSQYVIKAFCPLHILDAARKNSVERVMRARHAKPATFAGMRDDGFAIYNCVQL